MHVIVLPGPGIFLAQLSRVQNYIDARSHPQSNRDDVQTLLNQEPGAQGATSHNTRQPGFRAPGLSEGRLNYPHCFDWLCLFIFLSPQIF